MILFKLRVTDKRADSLSAFVGVFVHTEKPYASVAELSAASLSTLFEQPPLLRCRASPRFLHESCPEIHRNFVRLLHQ